jgi:hypothetical protein
VFGLSKEPLPEEQRGLAIATHGKLIRRDTLGMLPRSPERITGWVEVPHLVECLTLNKQDFVAQGALGERYLRIRKAVQKAFSEWLGEIGENVDAQDARRAPQQLQREVARILRSVAELRFLYGAVDRKVAEAQSPYGEEQGTFIEGLQLSGGLSSNGLGGDGGEGPTPVPGEEEGEVLVLDPEGTISARRRTGRTRSGPLIRLVPEPHRSDMGWVEGDTVFVNTAHRAYLKAQREHQLRYHQRIVVLLALSREAPIGSEHKLGILTRAVAEWGGG